MKVFGTRREASLKVLLVGLVAIVLVPAALQGLIDGAQQWESKTYTATVTVKSGPVSSCGGSAQPVTLSVHGAAQNITVLSNDRYSVSQVVSVVYHPAVLWAPSYWEIQTRGSCT
jgi:hypothetical protein